MKRPVGKSKAKNGVFIVRDELSFFVDGLARLLQQEVLVGVPAARGSRDSKLGDGTVNNAMLAYIHNFGSPEQNIPQREFMSPGIRAAKDRIASYLRQAGEYSLRNDQAGVDRAFHAAGLTAQLSIRDKIQDGPFQALSERTLAARRRKGRTGEKPLLDTSQMRSSINYVIRATVNQAGQRIVRTIKNAAKP